MKLSTRILRYVGSDLLGLHEDGNATDRVIRLISNDGKHDYRMNSLSQADRFHEMFIADGYKLGDLNECPVVNQKNECIMWYRDPALEDIKIGKKLVKYNTFSSGTVSRVVTYDPARKTYFCSLLGYIAEVKQINNDPDAVDGWETVDDWYLGYKDEE